MKPWLLLACAVPLLAGCDVEIPDPDAQADAGKGFSFESSDASTPDAKPEAQPAQANFGDVDEALAVFIKASADGEKLQQRAAYDWLCKQGGAAAPQVAAAMNDSSSPMKARRAACRVLGHLGPAAADALIEASKSEEAILQLGAIETMSAIEPPPKAVIERLIVLLDDPDNQVQKSTIGALGRIGPPAKAATDKLIALRNDGANDATRVAAGEALKLVDPRVKFDLGDDEEG